jgi:hypothetical protein
MFNFRKKVVPAANDTKEVLVYEMWEVRWDSRYGSLSYDTQHEVEVFPSEQDARDFAVALKNAFKLIKHTSGTDVSLRKIK